MFVRRDLTDFVPTPEGNIHFVSQGSGYPLVLLHPVGTSTWAWSGVIDALSEHYTCYAFDMLGHGQSDKPPRDFNLPDYARSLDHACQVLNIHRAHVVGNSVGALLAVETAASFPERVDKLVLVGCPVGDPNTAAQRLQESAAGFDENGLPKPRTAEDMKAATSFVDPKPEWVQAINETRAQAGAWVGKVSETLAYYSIVSRLPLIKATATLLLYGEADRLRAAEDILHHNIVGARKAVLPGLGHLPQVEGPQQFVEALLPFLQS